MPGGMSASKRWAANVPLVGRRAAMAMVLTAGFGLRLWWSGALQAAPHLSDPDGYLDLAAALIDEQGDWRWSVTAVTFDEFTKAPLYQVALSVLLLANGILPVANSGLALHAVLGTVTIAALYVAGRQLESPRAGLIAATLYAFWVPNVLISNTFWQEHLYVPLIMIGFAAGARATETDRRRDWLLTGAVFGLAALTRSTIAYFVPPAVLVAAAWPGNRPRRLVMAVALLSGFAVVAGPYIAYISSVTGRLTVVESIGYFSLKRVNHTSPVPPHVTIHSIMAEPSGPPTAAEAVDFMGLEFSSDPRAFVERRLEFVRLLLKPGGGSLVASWFLPTAAAATAARFAVHLSMDLPFMAVMIAAAFGLLAARSRLPAVLLAMWCVLHVGAVATMLWAGMRFRSPMEPAAILLASAVFANPRGWHATRTSLALAATAAAAIAWLVGASLPGVLLLRPNYGVSGEPRVEHPVTFTSEMGAYVSVDRPALSLSLEPLGASPGLQLAETSVFLDGRLADRFPLQSGRTFRRYPLKSPTRLYLEIKARGAAVPIELRIE